MGRRDQRTLALGLITEGIGLGLPITALPRFNDARPRTLPWRATSPLHEAGVTVLLEEDDFAPHKPKPERIQQNLVGGRLLRLRMPDQERHQALE